jgi:hypothetical protein
MEKLPLPPDFKDFLQLLNSEHVEYLLVGGYAVGYYGYPRATGDLDIWIAVSDSNAAKIVEVLRKFGFSAATIKPEFFTKPDEVFRMGLPPVSIDVITSASGVNFAKCYARRNVQTLDGVEVKLIHLDDLKQNKKSSGRPKDIDDVDNLPQTNQ